MSEQSMSRIPIAAAVRSAETSTTPAVEVRPIIPQESLRFLINYLEAALPTPSVTWRDRLAVVMAARDRIGVILLGMIGASSAAAVFAFLSWQASQPGSQDGIREAAFGTISAIMALLGVGTFTMLGYTLTEELTKRQTDRTKTLAERLARILGSPLVFRHSSPDRRGMMVLESLTPAVPAGVDTREVFGRLVDVESSPAKPAEQDHVELPTAVVIGISDYLQTMACQDGPHQAVARELVNRLSQKDEI